MTLFFKGVRGAAPPSPELPKTGATPAVAVPPKKN